ncbi:TfoX C-terminal domain-containing protein [Jannaschia faecimaris]|uniref:TfoX C-terminal domain-containing protein n=1 Tax=Jannaschia faecimaris TaxID=1244108 RepID=A0A1H3RP80_9RHOB|nr:TfoX/Sxy family protein [Jannaschia faecimaris]SDZ27496.1 TfoX C-terminal domain-containing protein [Jannaschia faecimaris]
MDNDAPLSTLRNLGPASEQAFARVNITTVGQLRDLGTDAAYARLIRAGTRPHFISYYVLEMALQGRPWNDCKGDEKTALRTRFDALKSAHMDPDRDAFEAIMDSLGVIER